jgi:hypothetical protein
MQGLKKLSKSKQDSKQRQKALLTLQKTVLRYLTEGLPLLNCIPSTKR